MSALSKIDPRRSLMAGTVWLIVALAASFSIAASLWVGSIARNDIVQQHMRRLALETDQLGTDLSQAVASRLDALGAAGRTLHALTPAVFDELQSAYPQLEWIALVNADGSVAATRNRGGGALAAGSTVAGESWFTHGVREPATHRRRRPRATHRASANWSHRFATRTARSSARSRPN